MRKREREAIRAAAAVLLEYRALEEAAAGPAHDEALGDLAAAIEQLARALARLEPEPSEREETDA